MSEAEVALASPPRARGPGAGRFLRAARAAVRRARRMPRCSRPSPQAAAARAGAPADGSRATGREDLADAWDSLRAASAVMDRGSRRRRVPGAVRRRRHERGEPLRIALSRAAVGASARRDPRDARRARPRPAARKQRVRGPPLRRCWKPCGCSWPATRAASRDDRRAARFLRNPSAAVGLRLLHCNIDISPCQLLSRTSHNSQVVSWRSNVTRSPWNELHQRHAVFLEVRMRIPTRSNSLCRDRSGCRFPPPIRNAAASCSRWARAARVPLRPSSARCTGAAAVRRGDAPHRRRLPTVSRVRARARLLPHRQALGGGGIMLLTRTSAQVSAAGPRLRRLAGGTAPDDGPADVFEALGPRRRGRSVREPASLRRHRQGRGGEGRRGDARSKSSARSARTARSAARSTPPSRTACGRGRSRCSTRRSTSARTARRAPSVREHGMHEHSMRLKSPMKLVNGKYQKISWEQAINEVGDRSSTRCARSPVPTPSSGSAARSTTTSRRT